jgi:hypothetical protein
MTDSKNANRHHPALQLILIQYHWARGEALRVGNEALLLRR